MSKRENSFTAKVWYLVPARGGSKGIIRKNLRPLNSVPLILHCLKSIRKIADKSQVIVSSEDQEILNFVQSIATPYERPPALATDSATLDEVAADLASKLLRDGAGNDDIVITVQPTSPFLEAHSLRRAEEMFQKNYDCVISVKEDRHLRWTVDSSNQPVPLFSERLNRQWLPPCFGETGGIIACRLGALAKQKRRIQGRVGLIQLSDREALDIDTHSDWAVAEFFSSQKRVVIRADASSKMGMGHVYRALALYQELSFNQISVLSRSDGDYQLGFNFLREHCANLIGIQNEDEFLAKLKETLPDITILDILDTQSEFISQIKAFSKKVVSFEDLGSGSRVADLVINDLYTDLYPQKNHFYGIEYSVLSPAFESVDRSSLSPTEERRIFVAFGGTDPSELSIRTLKSLNALASQIDKVDVVLGPGYAGPEIRREEFTFELEVHRAVKNMPALMRRALVAITSGGRTVTELMTLGVPTVVLCQNIRELRHTHASSTYGVMNLGMGRFVEDSTLVEHLQLLLGSRELREDMRARALAATKQRSNKRVAKLILDLCDKNCEET